ncbi:MAG: non-ribosomal peptide synthetase [Acidobacteria bacterium]|nr:non-ribosomal peptide synthetase [Acidobacteriota bacterium]MBV9477694.1 non-ribosomal peptide synthetase [Acidobacteriota bacterium]
MSVNTMPSEVTITQRFREVVDAAPDAPALTAGNRVYTYVEIDRWSDAIAADLAALNAPVDRPVAIVTSDSISLVPAAMAVVKAGHFFVMIDASDPDERVALLLRESDAGACLVDDEFIAPASARALPFATLRPFSRELTAKPPARAPHPFVYVIYTSGTTGKPKGILTSHRRFVEKTTLQSRRWGRAPGERASYTALPGYTRAASNIFGSLLTGSTMCAFDVRSESLTALADYIRRERITLLSLTPSLFRRLIAASGPSLDVSSVKKLRVGADKITVADVESYKKYFPRGCVLALGFASTESGRVFSWSIDHDTPIPGPLVPMGYPYPDVAVRLIDEDGNDVPDGEPGEIVVRSEEVADGYWKNPELTAQRFVFHPDDPERRTFYTGDLAKRDASGLHYFVGRKDARLKIHGRRIDPTEVEALLIATGEVRDAVIVGKTDEEGEQRLVAYVVMRDGKRCDARAIRAKLRETAPSWMVPQRIYALDAIPMTRNAKVDRAALAARDDRETGEDHGATNDIERQLVEVWSRVLGTTVHVDDDFFNDHGGESVVAAHLVAEVARATGHAIALSLLLELNTIRKMADYLRGTTVTDRVAVLVQRGSDSVPPLFCVSGGGGSVMVFRDLAAQIGSEQPFWGLQHHGFARGVFPVTYAAIAAVYGDAIRAIQPHGPYFLAGYSVGGQLAYEVARQMERAGERVAFIGLIDSSASDMRTSVWKRIANRFVMLRRDPRRGVYYAREAVTRPTKALRRRLPRMLQQANNTYMSSRRGFTLQPYGGAVSLFRARHGMGAARVERDLGWLRVGVGRLDIYDVDGDHESLLARDVGTLAGAFRRALALARESESVTVSS